MEIRGKKRHLRRFRKALDKSGLPGITLRESDQKVPKLVIQADGEFIRKASGRDQVLSFCRTGHVDVRRRCPHRLGFRKCIGRECGRYFIYRGVGDCGYFWDTFLRVEETQKEQEKPEEIEQEDNEA